MIKIFNATDTDFSTAGNIIIDPLYCHETKKKSLNGWYLDVEVPIKYAEYISKDKLCVVKTKSKLNPQAFRISEEIQRSTRKIKFKAEHVMFDARDYALIDVRPTNQNGLNALNYINERTDEVSPFVVHSNVETINTAYFIRKNLLEAWTIIEERWEGVFDADNWDVSFLKSVGNDNGETIIYGKNMQGFDIYEDWSSVCTKLFPVGYDGLMLPEQFLISDVKYEKPYTRIVDFQTELETEEQTEENLLNELRSKANEYLEENKTPKVSYTIISNINNELEIGDTIKVLHPYVNIFTEVLEYEYDLISKKIKSLTFGNYSRDVKTKFDNIKNTITQINQVISKQDVVINNQTNLINSLNKNGYVYIDDNEILILDKLPKEKAENVWRIGMAGIGFSSNGYEGPFEIAITMDGQINADFITTGTLSVGRIEGLSNFISETEKQISEIEIEQGKITSRVSSVEENTVKTVQVQYALGSSTTEAPTSGWSTTAPTWESGKYMWQRTVTTYSDDTTKTSEPTCIQGAKGENGTNGKDGVNGKDGDTGIGVNSLETQYYLSTSDTEQVGGDWSSTEPKYEADKYYWTRTKIIWTDNSVTYTAPILAEGINNANKEIGTVKTSVAEQKLEIGKITQTVSETQTMASNNYTELKEKFNDYAPKSDIVTIQNSVEKIQTDTYTKTEINTKLTDGSVTKVSTTTGTFDDNGLTIEKTDAKTKGNFNEKGITVMDATSSSAEELLFAGYDEELSEIIVRTKNINVGKYLTKCNIAREEAYINPTLGGKGIGVFIL